MVSHSPLVVIEWGLQSTYTSLQRAYLPAKKLNFCHYRIHANELQLPATLVNLTSKSAPLKIKSLLTLPKCLLYYKKQQGKMRDLRIQYEAAEEGPKRRR